jgi:DNA ligase (NAD+)
MDRIKELEKDILKNKRLYYSGNAIIEDEEYDALENELRMLDKDNHVFSVVGSDFFTGEKVKHEEQMLSLSKTTDINELEKWRDNQEVIATYKIDGNAASLIYENGSLVLAKTRGDGQFGERITNQAFFIKSIPKKVKENNKVEIRGEIYCSHSNFEILSNEMEKRGMDRPKSERNIVAGILGRKDHRDLAEFMSFFAFDYISEREFEKEEDKNKELEKEKFILPPTKLVKNKKELEEFVLETSNFMENGEFLIDGAVISINSIEKQEELGFTSHHPKFKLAFKFEGEVKEAIISNIEWQISRFGVYTPVGIIEPVECGGATISKLTLHNVKNVRAFQLKKGDKIKLKRSGEVIPKFLSVVESSKEIFLLPEECEYCKTKLIEDDVRLICNNESCSGRHKEYIVNFAQKIGIDDISDKRLDSMIELGLVTDIPSIFKLTKEQLLTLPKTKEKMATKILKNIEKVKSIGVIKFFSSLNFTGGSRKSTELILDTGVSSFEEFHKLKVEDLENIKGFAKKKAVDYVESLKRNKSLIEELLALGFEIDFPKKAGNSLAGITFCITGEVLIAKNRKELENLIKSFGGKASSSLSAKTNYLICNQESNSSKYKKALTLEIPILTEEQFEKEFGISIS